MVDIGTDHAPPGGEGAGSPSRIRARTTDDGKSAYVQLLESCLDAERQLNEDQLSAARERVDELSRDLVQAVRAVHGARRRSRDLNETAGVSREEREREYDSLLSLPGVRGVDVSESVVTIRTSPLVLEHDGDRFLIGEFALDLDLEGSITVRNLANTISKGGWEHPHVQGGVPCLGNLRNGMMKLLGECEVVPLASMLIQFLHSYDPETAYCRVEMWEELR